MAFWCVQRRGVQGKRRRTYVHGCRATAGNRRAWTWFLQGCNKILGTSCITLNWLASQAVAQKHVTEFQQTIIVTVELRVIIGLTIDVLAATEPLMPESTARFDIASSALLRLALVASGRGCRTACPTWVASDRTCNHGSPMARG